MIPGAFVKRAARPVALPAAAAVESATRHIAAPKATDRDRLEHEREGGGAPSERKIKPALAPKT